MVAPYIKIPVFNFTRPGVVIEHRTYPRRKRKKSSYFVHTHRVEHVISGVKRYRIVKDKLRNWKKGFSDLVMETCCGLHNFRLNLADLGVMTHLN